jgi:hypothetical protein
VIVPEETTTAVPGARSHTASLGWSPVEATTVVDPEEMWKISRRDKNETP